MNHDPASPFSGSRISRRDFIAAATLASAGAAVGGAAARALAQGSAAADAPAKGAAALQGSAGSASPAAPVITGSGRNRYSVQHDWIVPPPGARFGDTHGVAQDRAGRIYVAHTVGEGSESANAVCVYGPDGTFVTSWGPQWRGGAHGLDIRDEKGQEFLYHCDTGRRTLTKTSLDGAVIWERQCPMESGVYGSPGEWCPTNVAFSPDGALFVGDGYGKGFIHRYGANGEWQKVITRPGSGKGETSCPHGMCVDMRGSQPMLVVADRGNRRIQVLDLDGAHVAFHAEGIRMPCDMKVRNGQMLVPDLESVVTILDEKFAPVAALGDGHPSSLRGAPRDQFVPGKFVHPHDAIWLADGSILVAEWVPIGRVTRLVPVT